MILPRSLQLDEQRPSQQQWRCTVHGVLPAGESECGECLPESRDVGDRS